MKSKLRVVNLLPTYNEIDNIIPMLKALNKIAIHNKKYEFVTLVVDDNSPDGTGVVVKEFKSILRNPVYLLTGSKQGLGRAIVKGIKYAIKYLKADIIVSNECDFAFDPELIPRFLAKIDAGFDVVIGSRHIREGKTTGWTMSRKINHWIANTFFATWIAGITNISDHNGLFRVVRVKNILDKMTWKNAPYGFGFLNYWAWKMTLLTDKICELPVTYHFRTKGESKVSFNTKYAKTYLRDVIEYIKICLAIRLQSLNIRG